MPESSAQPETRRPGGRTARTRDAVLAATAELLAARDGATPSLAEIAERSGVHLATVYRRWGSADAILIELAEDRIEAEAPIRDTGVLRDDLLSYGRGAAASIAGSEGLALLRALVNAGTTGTGSGTPTTDVAAAAAAIPTDADGAANDDDAADAPPEASAGTPSPALLARGAALQAVLDRAGERGEPALHFTEVLDGVLAPIYLRRLFGIGGVDEAFIAALVDRTLAAHKR